MVYWIYFLLVGDRSRGYNRKIYIGMTRYLNRRIAEHSGLTSSGRGARLTRRQQIELVYVEKYSTRKEASTRERELKRKNPFNQKKYKLQLIQKFHKKEKFKNINQKLQEHFQFLGLLEKTMNELEKELLADF